MLIRDDTAKNRGGKGSRGRQQHLEYALLGLVVDERDDACAGSLDELDVGGGDVGGGRAVVDPAPRAVPRVRDDPDHGAVVQGGVRLHGARRCRLPGARQPDDPRRRRGGGQEDRQEEREQVEVGRRGHLECLASACVGLTVRAGERRLKPPVRRQ